MKWVVSDEQNLPFSALPFLLVRLIHALSVLLREFASIIGDRRIVSEDVASSGQIGA
jgi:hypothetical protein